MEKATLGFCIYKIWQILKHFAGTFRRAQTLKLGGVAQNQGVGFLVLLNSNVSLSHFLSLFFICLYNLPCTVSYSMG